MVERPEVHARVDVLVKKPPSQKHFGTFTRRQTLMITDAAALLGAAAAQEFVIEVFQTIRDRVSNDDFAFALRVLLAEHESEDVIEQVLQNNRSKQQ
jgi:hypothetical protein